MQATSHQQLWKRLRADPLGAFSLGFIVVMAGVALFAYQLAPDATPNANEMHLSIHSQPPGFKVQMLQLPLSAPQQKEGNFLQGKPTSFTKIPIQDWKLQEGVVYIQPFGRTKDYFEPLAQTYSASLSNPKAFMENNVMEQNFILGTDKYGRDLLSRLLIGTRISIAIGFVSVAISLLIGIVLGALGGYFGGRIDAFIMGLINIVWSIPTLLLVIALTLVLGRGFWQVFLAVGLSMWVEIARLVRGQVKGLKEKTYIQAAHALGFTDFQIIFKHILPMVVAPVLVVAAANFASAILIESGLSFLGIGAQPPTPSWGGMIKDHFRYLLLGKPYLAVLPGVCIMFTVLAFMTLGNSLRDALDVRN
jgi:peptide/nickel transport system permease protein